MRLIIAGGRDLTIDPHWLRPIVSCLGLPENIEIVSGGANGIDKSGEVYAKKYGIKLTIFPADWTKYGKSAGHKRNLQMAQYSDALLLIWNGQSKGSANMKARMLAQKKPVKEIIYTENNEFRIKRIK